MLFTGMRVKIKNVV